MALSKKETEQVNECVRRVLVPSSTRENAKGYVRLPLRSVSSKTVLYSAVRSLLSPVFCVFSNFAPIPMYRENETPCAIPT